MEPGARVVGLDGLADRVDAHAVGGLEVAAVLAEGPRDVAAAPGQGVQARQGLGDGPVVRGVGVGGDVGARQSLGVGGDVDGGGAQAAAAHLLGDAGGPREQVQGGARPRGGEDLPQDRHEDPLGS